MRAASSLKVTVADETWVATALLHREHPKRRDFAVSEIVARVREEEIMRPLRAGVRVHATLHCVANLPANPARYRMLFATGRSTRRLYRPGDATHPTRSGKVVPRREDIPPVYGALLDWYQNDYAARSLRTDESDPLLALRGSGRKLWADEHADDYVRRLRAGWR